MGVDAVTLAICNLTYNKLIPYLRAYTCSKYKRKKPYFGQFQKHFLFSFKVACNCIRVYLHATNKWK